MVVKVSKPALNLREKLSELSKPSGIAGEAMLRAETPQEQFNLIGAGRRNILINGGFEVSQRGSYTSATSYNDGAYLIDRWQTLRDGVTANLQHLVPVAGESSYGVKLIATSSATGTIRLRQRLEIPNIYTWGGRTFTLSARVKSNSSNARLMMYGGSGGGYVTMTSGNDSHSGGGTIETLTATFTTTGSVSSEFAAFVGIDNARSASDTTIVTGDYFEVYDFQMEEGKVATPFEHRSYGEELAACQRYYQQFFDESGVNVQVQLIGLNSTSGHFVWWPPVQMRARPTVGITTTTPYWESYPWNTPGTSLTISTISNGHMGRSGGEIAVFGSFNPALVRGTNYTMSAEALYWDAEL